MTEPKTPDEFHVPSKRTLLEATGVAAAIALVVLVAFIMPAEYGVDPLGIGNVLGITDIASPGHGGSVHTMETMPYRTDSVNITIPAGVGLEFKFRLAEGSGLVYSWVASAPVFFDFHGEPTGDTTGYFESYQADTAAGADGSFSAPFAGTHGWYWQNDSGSDITVTLQTAGHYEIVGLV